MKGGIYAVLNETVLNLFGLQLSAVENRQQAPSEAA